MCGQAKKYAEKLQTRFTYSTNGAGIYQIDMHTGAEGYIERYPRPKQLWQATFEKENAWRDRFGEVPFEDKGGQWQARYYQHNAINKALEAIAAGVETFAGKVHIEWDPTAAVTPIGQLPFFIEFLKLGHRFNPWVEDCPLHYVSHNAPQKIDVLGSLFLSILSGHNRYTHMTALRGDSVNTKLLGMSKVISDDSAIRALKRMAETEAVQWLQDHLQSCYAPLLSTPWILDVDVTVKPLYGHQEGAKVGYNPHKPGRPSHTYHSYLMANTRLVLEVEVQPGDQSQSAYSMPGLIRLLQRLPQDGQPAFIRGDCEWGNDPVMSELEAMDRRYLFKLKRSKRVKELITQVHGQGVWTRFNPEWELKESTLQLQGWERARRVVVARRRLARNLLIGLEYQQGGQRELALVEGPEICGCLNTPFWSRTWRTSWLP